MNTLKTYEKHAFCGELQAFAYEKLEPGAVTALQFTAATMAVDGKQPAVRAFITTEDADVRYRLDGGLPTTAVGHKMQADGVIEIEGINNLKNFRVISTAGTAKLLITYARYEG